MDQKFDSALIRQLIGKIEEKTIAAANTYKRIAVLARSVDQSEWDDSKRKQFAEYMQNLNESMISYIGQMKDYLGYLKGKVTELENR